MWLKLLKIIKNSKWWYYHLQIKYIHTPMVDIMFKTSAVLLSYYLVIFNNSRWRQSHPPISKSPRPPGWQYFVSSILHWMWSFHKSAIICSLAISSNMKMQNQWKIFVCQPQKSAEQEKKMWQPISKINIWKIQGKVSWGVGWGGGGRDL